MSRHVEGGDLIADLGIADEMNLVANRPCGESFDEDAQDATSHHAGGIHQNSTHPVTPATHVRTRSSNAAIENRSAVDRTASRSRPMTAGMART